METTGRRVVQMSDWAPAQEAMFEESTSGVANQTLVEEENRTATPTQSRFRSMSVSLAWRSRPKSGFFEDDHGGQNLALEKSKSHGFGGRHDDGNSSQGSSSKPEHHHNIKRMLRRASVSLRSGVKGFVHQRTSVPAAAALDADGQQQRPRLFLSPGQGASPHAAARPTTSHSTWHRLRQATSFHRHSRMLYTGHGERTFELDPSPIESPTFPVPGSGEQPPIIPRNTGAAARQAAASACNGVQGYEFMETVVPRPGWLAEDGLDDRESGIGIALTSSEMETYVPADETDIVKVDFISQLPTELAIQILAQLDATTLSTASRVSRDWSQVVRNQHIWRESFLREHTTTYATSRPVKPGTGLGVPAIQPGNDWREMYRAKSELDKRWKKGKAEEVYLNGHTDSIYCLQFDESKIITGSRDRTIRVWDLHTFACKLVIGPPEVVNDGSFALLYDENGNPVHYATVPDLLRTTDGQPRNLIRAHHSTPALYAPPIHHKASILCLQYDDRILVTGSSDSTCIVYNIHSGYRPIRRLKHHNAAVLDLVFDDKHIVTCSKDISICVWDRATGNLLKQLRGHTGPVNAVQMRGNTIVSCSGDFRVKLWNIDTGKNIREFLGHNKGLACSQFSEDGRYVASAGNDKVIRIWDANTGECVHEMKAHDNLVRSLHVDSVSGRLISGSYDSDIKVWDMESGEALLDFPKWHSSWVLSAKSDYRRIISSGQDPKILILDFGAGVRGIEMLESRPPLRQSGVAVEAGGYI
ncbi:WD40-repeat-containing domain protein [Lasiosphaeria miniovina]|uniref:WD40-repeat-containing domain protein n=1 Tax=Lasiosphaeria miniovina TaxID=1954250 RepID=A0AA40AKW1_9PEZI|nr:WD40-repeat-containing domain protein [Lasiosphaeria miniovina]KAK0717731.1 WD40-repeat-containing domain protein [Lasiosphaeria miniovina]